MNAVLLLLLDSRAPAGGHNHSGGMEPAIETGLVRDLPDVEALCRARLRTSGHVAAGFAAAACGLVRGERSGRHSPCPAAARAREHSAAEPDPLHAGADPLRADAWAGLDAELDARTPSPAARAASRQLGHGLRRLLRATLPELSAPEPALTGYSADNSDGIDGRWEAVEASWAGVTPSAPHHPLVLGAGIACAGGTPNLAARAARLNSITGPASAAVRLLGLDPLAVHGMLTRLAGEIDAAPTPNVLPIDCAPALDLLADFHLTREVRLFAS